MKRKNNNNVKLNQMNQINVRLNKGIKLSKEIK